MADTDALSRLIAAELRAELGRQNRSRRWLAEKTGHSHVSVSRWLATGSIPLCTFIDLCDALGTSPSAFLANIEEIRTTDAPHPRRRREDVRLVA